MNGTECIFPDVFVQALIDSGHKVECCPRSAITTFGLACCIKEMDDSWTNVPIAYFFRTGYERSDQRPAYFSAPHGGMDMKIDGPLVGSDPTTGQPYNCNIQFYMAIGTLERFIFDVRSCVLITTSEKLCFVLRPIVDLQRDCVVGIVITTLTFRGSNRYQQQMFTTSKQP
jgi:hypothetical protein